MSSRCPMRAVIVLMLTIATTPLPSAAGPGEAGRDDRKAGTFPAGADFIVLVWYRGDDALATFAHQEYDLRKGEYSAAVDDWIAMLRAKYPRYEVHVLPVDLDRERGATEKLRVGSVIHRELLMAAARSGVVLGAPMRVGQGPTAAHRPTPGTSIRTEAPGAGGTNDINPVGRTTPFPIPYPRPHP